MNTESFSYILKNYDYVANNKDYAIMREIFNQKNISTMLEKGMDPLDYINYVTNKNKSNININNISKVIDKTDINIIDFLNRINARITYIGSGTTGHFFRGSIYKYYYINGSRCRNRLCYFALKVTGYIKNPHYKSIYQISRPENTEINMMSILSRLVIEGKTKHLLLPIKTYYTDIAPFIKMYVEKHIKPESDKNGKYKDFVEKYNNGYLENTVSLLFYEFANGGDLLKFIRANNKKLNSMHWKVIVFQLLSVLSVIQNRYPSFRHNDLKANNVLIELTRLDYENINYTNRIIYNIGNKKYKIPDIGINIKLWDFDFACIPNICENIKVHEHWTNKINITTKQNRYYDIHYFFRTLINNAFFPDILSNDPKYTDIKKFISDVLPPQYISGNKISKYGRLLVDDEYTTPQKLLETNKYFDEFIF